MIALAIAACDEDEGREVPTTLDEPVGPHDVSVLFPMPEVLGQQTSLIGADASGRRGPLLPEDTYLALPMVDNALSNHQSYSLLRVVSARFDPCFPGLGEPCQNQIRLVMQPVTIDPTGEKVVANDAAIHLFYSLTREELEAVLRQVVDLRRASGFEVSSEPLGPHPAIVAEGVEGAFARGFRDVLVMYAGQANLVRVTSMVLAGAKDDWRFSGFDIVDGEMVPMDIPGLGATEQSFVNADQSGAGFDQVSVSPESTSADDFTLLLDPAAAAAATAEARVAAFGALLRVENPQRHSPATVDCVSCHIAPLTRAFAQRELGLAADGSEDVYVSAEGSEPAGGSQFATHMLRAFGVFGHDPAIAQRTVNETDAVVAYVNEQMVGD